MRLRHKLFLTTALALTTMVGGYSQKQDNRAGNDSTKSEANYTDSFFIKHNTFFGSEGSLTKVHVYNTYVAPPTHIPQFQFNNKEIGICEQSIFGCVLDISSLYNLERGAKKVRFRWYSSVTDLNDKIYSDSATVNNENVSTIIKLYNNTPEIMANIESFLIDHGVVGILFTEKEMVAYADNKLLSDADMILYDFNRGLAYQKEDEFRPISKKEYDTLINGFNFGSTISHKSEGTNNDLSEHVENTITIIQNNMSQAHNTAPIQTGAPHQIAMITPAQENNNHIFCITYNITDAMKQDLYTDMDEDNVSDKQFNDKPQRYGRLYMKLSTGETATEYLDGHFKTIKPNNTMSSNDYTIRLDDALGTTMEEAGSFIQNNASDIMTKINENNIVEINYEDYSITQVTPNGMTHTINMAEGKIYHDVPYNHDKVKYEPQKARSSTDLSKIPANEYQLHLEVFKEIFEIGLQTGNNPSNKKTQQPRF